jgi:hypothetical protein
MAQKRTAANPHTVPNSIIALDFSMEISLDLKKTPLYTLNRKKQCFINNSMLLSDRLRDVLRFSCRYANARPGGGQSGNRAGCHGKRTKRHYKKRTFPNCDRP